MLRFLRRATGYVRHRFLDAPRGFGKPVPPAAFDAEYRSGHWDEFSGTDEAPRYERLVALIQRLHPRPRLLDLGCGSGRLAALLTPEAVVSYLGIDLSAEGLARARALRLPHAHFEPGDFNTWRPAAPADLIIFNESIGYARDPAAVLRAFTAHLAPRGSLIVSLYRSGNWAAVWRRIGRDFTFPHAELVRGGRGLQWDLKQLAPRASAP